MRKIAAALAVVGTLIIGATTTNQVAYAATPVQDPVQVMPKMIVVNPGDYLQKIADANNSTVQRLFDANVAIQNPDLIFPGQQLKVPDEKEQLTTRAMPDNSYVASKVEAEQQTAAKVTPTRTRTPSTPASAAPSGSSWDKLAQCEAGGNWAINTGNGYYGGLQFTLSSWKAVGGTGYPHEASRDEQIMRGQMLQARQGWGAWPACSNKLGL